MTKQQFIAHALIAFLAMVNAYGNSIHDFDSAIKKADKLAKDFEESGKAPWTQKF